MCSELERCVRMRFRREEAIAGVLASAIANFSAHPPKNPLGPSDFFASIAPPEREEKRMTGEQMLAVFDRCVGVEKAAGRLTVTGMV